MAKKAQISECRTTAIALKEVDADAALTVRKPSLSPAVPPTPTRVPSLTPPKTPTALAKLPPSAPKMPALPKKPTLPALPGARKITITRRSTGTATKVDDSWDVDDFVFEDDWDRGSSQPLIDRSEQRGTPRIKQNKVKSLEGPERHGTPRIGQKSKAKLLEGPPAKSAEQGVSVPKLPYDPSAKK